MTGTLRLTQFAAFVGLGLSMSLMGPMLPAIQREIAMSDLQAGLVLSGQFLGMILTVPFGGHLADRFGKKPFLLASSAASVIGLTGYAFAHGFAGLLLASVVTGVGSGGYQVGVNALQADQAREDGAGAAMNALHFFYGLGAILGPFLAAAVVQGGLDWRFGFAAVALVPVAVALLLRPQHLAGAPTPTPGRDGSPYGSSTLWLCALLLAVYVGIETSVYGWIATFWARRIGPGAIDPPLVAAVFWATLTAGRLVSGRLTDRVGHVVFVGRAAAATLAVGLVWSIWPTAWVTFAAVLLLGLSLAGVFPTTMAVVTGAFPGHSGKVVALSSLFASLGGFAVPPLVGRLADAHGIGILPPVVSALAAVLLAAVLRLRAVVPPPEPAA